MFYSAFSAFKVVAFLAAVSFWMFNSLLNPRPVWAETNQESALSSSSSPDALLPNDTTSLGPVFAPLTERKDLNFLNRLPAVLEAERTNLTLMEEASQYQTSTGTAMGEVMGLETQTEAEKVIFHDDGTVEFRDNMQPLLLNQKDILSSDTSNPSNSSADGEAPSFLRELDNENDYLLFTAPLSTESYEVSTEERLIDPEVKEFLPGFQQAFSGMYDGSNLQGNQEDSPASILTGKKMGKLGKKRKIQNNEPRKPPVRPLQQSPPLPTIESIHITRLNRTQPAAEKNASASTSSSQEVNHPEALQLNAQPLTTLDTQPADKIPDSTASNRTIPNREVGKINNAVKARAKTSVRKKASSVRPAIKHAKTKHLKTVEISEKDLPKVVSESALKQVVPPSVQSDVSVDAQPPETETTHLPLSDTDVVSTPAIQQNTDDDTETSEQKPIEQERTLQELIQRLEAPAP